MVNLIGAHAPWEFDRALVERRGVDVESVAPPDRWQDVAARSEAQWPYAAGEVTFDDTDREILRHLYRSWIRRVDALTGRLLRELDETGVRDETLVVLTSDHGERLAVDGVLGHSVDLHDEVIHVPLVVDGPGISAETVTEPVSLKHIHGTVLTETGVDPDARSLLCSEARGPAFAETFGANPERLDPEYRHVAEQFGPRCALVTTNGRVERREGTSETFGDQELVDELDVFLESLTPSSAAAEASSSEVPESVERRLRELGYR